jgi:hypothetical protein
MTLTVTARHRAPSIALLRPRAPAGLGWRCMGALPDPRSGADLLCWRHVATSTQVLSSLVIAELPRGGATGPQWHASVVDRSTETPARPSEAQTLLTRCAFDLLTAEEDNHHPGAARQFWLPVDPAERRDCECKETEVQVVEADGYRWSNDPTSCRGCALEQTMREVGTERPCPLHAATRTP